MRAFERDRGGVEHGPDDGRSGTGAGVERGFLKDAIERDCIFAIDGEQRHTELVAEASDGFPGEGIAVGLGGGAEFGVGMDSGDDEEQRELVGLSEAERGRPVGLDGVFVGVGEDEIFGFGIEAVGGDSSSGEAREIESGSRDCFL